MSTAAAGRRREWRVRDHLEAHGWVHVMRAAASKGPADLLVAHEQFGAALIQVGTESKRLGPAARERFVHAAELCHALPLLAVAAPRTAPRYYHVTRGLPATWPTYDIGGTQ